MRIPKEEYKKAVGILKRYNYNCITIMNIRTDIFDLSNGINDGQPKAINKISDSVCDKLIQLEEDKEFQRAMREYKIVKKALALVSNDSKYIFDELYRKNKTKWEIIDEMGVSEETYKRRKSELVYAIHKELKK